MTESDLKRLFPDLLLIIEGISDGKDYYPEEIVTWGEFISQLPRC